MTEQPIKKEIVVTTTTPTKSENRPVRKKADYKKFVKFYALPTFYRQDEFGIKTEQEFAKKYGLCQDTLTDWKKRTEFNKDLDDQLMKWGSDKTPDVIAALFRTILADGKAAEVKLWLQFMKGWKEGMTIEQTIEEKSNPLIDILDKLDEPTRNKIIGQLEREIDNE
jgi:hypothetical protein